MWLPIFNGVAPGASNNNFKNVKIYDHFFKSPELGNKSINKQAVTPCKNTKIKFYCWIFHSISEVDGRRYFILSWKKRKALWYYIEHTQFELLNFVKRMFTRCYWKWKSKNIWRAPAKTLYASRATNKLYLSSPFGEGKGFSNLFHSFKGSNEVPTVLTHFQSIQMLLLLCQTSARLVLSPISCSLC
jgi:hypothetical protein